MARAEQLRRFTLVELGLWASLYPAYLAVRGATIGNPAEATAHAARVVDLERAFSLFHEHRFQQTLDFASACCLHPLVMAATVTATGNHYFLDSIAGSAAALSALALVTTIRRLRLRPQRAGAQVLPFPVARRQATGDSADSTQRRAA
jgi:hypothetical protein